MATACLHIENHAHRLALGALLAAGGHRAVEGPAEVVICDDPVQARRFARQAPTLLLAAASEIPEAVEAMRAGVFGYLFVPFQPGEAVLMVARAAASGKTSGVEST